MSAGTAVMASLAVLCGLPLGAANLQVQATVTHFEGTSVRIEVLDPGVMDFMVGHGIAGEVEGLKVHAVFAQGGAVYFGEILAPGNK